MVFKTPMARRQKQLTFTGKLLEKPNASFGGSLLKSNPKRARPLDSKLPIHVTLRSKSSSMRLPKIYGVVNEIVFEAAEKHGITIYKYANVGNHLHMVIKLASLRSWAAFIRELTGRIGLVMRLKMGLSGKFWKYRPHTRIVQSWKKMFRVALDYVELNILEAEGFISRRETKTLKDLRAIFSG